MWGKAGPKGKSQARHIWGNTTTKGSGTNNRRVGNSCCPVKARS